ncbi:MAG: hypothetical protein ACR2FN_14710 [Chitinophagaceae bacterium]
MNAAYIQQFEKEKNLKALGITMLITGAIFLFFFLVSWTLPVTPLPPADEGVEVNLGNSDQGLGNIAPQIPGEPSAAEKSNYNPPKISASKSEPEQTKEVAQNNEPDAPTIHTSTKPVIKPNPKEVVENTSKKSINQPIINPTPTPPKPKAVYKGGTSAGSGGNNADSYNGIKNQGIAGGNGDQGKPNGNPNSDSYTGNGGTGKSGVTIRSGLSGRRFTHLPSFQDEFNENAKVAVDITVDANGNVIAASVNPRGTTTTNQNIRSIAIDKAKQLKLNSGNVDEQTGTIVFDFKLRS